MILQTKLMVKEPKRKTSNLPLEWRTWLPATTLKPPNGRFGESSVNRVSLGWVLDLSATASVLLS